jgi:hypothetical protein
MFRTRLAGLLAAVPLLLAAAPAQAQTAPAGGCQFQGGFANLAGMIPDVVGSCTADQHTANQQGDTIQPTSNGLLSWTKATNVTEFTTGEKTWILSGYGLITRDANTAYSWEGATSLVAGVAINSQGQMVDPATGKVMASDAHVKAG